MRVEPLHGGHLDDVVVVAGDDDDDGDGVPIDRILAGRPFRVARLLMDDVAVMSPGQVDLVLHCRCRWLSLQRCASLTAGLMADLEPAFARLHHLDLSGNSAREHLDVVVIARVLPRLTELILEGCDLVSDDVVVLADAMRVDPRRMRLLNLSANAGLGDEGLQALCAGLEGHANLADLSLADCGLTAAGASLLSDALATLPDLQSLNLEFNVVGDDAVARLMNVMAQTGTVRSVNVAQCGCDPIKVVEAAAAVPTIVDLVCDGAPAPAVASVVERHRAACSEAAKLIFLASRPARTLLCNPSFDRELLNLIFDLALPASDADRRRRRGRQRHQLCQC
ncbi:Leucine-rich repeat-containing protein [Plasmodiophora brassicae]